MVTGEGEQSHALFQKRLILGHVRVKPYLNSVLGVLRGEKWRVAEG